MMVLDAYSRRMVGWAMADHLRAELALAALNTTLASREVIPGGLVHHSDRGMQGGFKRWSQRVACRRSGAMRQMSRPAFSSQGLCGVVH